MDNVDKICNGADNLDLMAKQIKQVVMRIADYVDCKARHTDSELAARLKYFRHVQIGDWWIYCKHNENNGQYRQSIRVDVSAGSLDVVSADSSGGYHFQQPSHYRIKEVRAKLPVFLAQMEAEFPDIKEWFTPFYDAADA